jgi:UDP-N-acetylmuramate dehydrogenase
MIKIQENVPLAPHTAFRIGGPAKFFVEVKSQEELEEAVLYAEKNNLWIFILGGGSNILVSDQGFSGLVIKILIDSISAKETALECGAGVRLSEIVSLATRNNLSGLEWAAGIPGTLGGAIRGNAGAFGGEIGSSMKSVKAFNLENKKTETLKKTECEFAYRDSIFRKNSSLVVVSATLELKKGSREEIEKRIQENIKKRIERQPQGVTSAGSFFENPIVTSKEVIRRYEEDTGNEVVGYRMSAGWLISDVGFLGKKIGGAKVSEKNGNFVVNLGDAKAEDVVMLASLIKQKVRKLGVQLREEVKLVGF